MDDDVSLTLVLRPRWLAVVTYLVFAVAGTAFIALPTGGSLTELLGGWGVVAWNGMMVLGSGTSLAGALTRRYLIELCGLPALSLSLAIWGSALLLVLPGSAVAGVVVGLAGVMFGAAIGIVGRAVELLRVVRIITHISEESSGAQ